MDVPHVSCPSCGKRYRVPPEFEGKKVRCPACGHSFRLSEQEPQAPPASDPREPNPKVRPGKDVRPAHTPGSETALGRVSAEVKRRLSPWAARLPGRETVQARVGDKAAGSLAALKGRVVAWAGTVPALRRLGFGHGPDAEHGEEETKTLARRLRWAVIALLVVFASVMSWYWVKGTQAQRDYKRLMLTTSQTQDLRLVQIEYRKFMRTHPDSRFAEKLAAELERFPERIEQQDYENLVRKTKALGEAYEDVAREYEKFLEGHPEGAHATSVSEQLRLIPERIEDRDYRNMLARVEAYDADPAGSRKPIQEFLDRHPDGAHAQEAKDLLGQVPKRVVEKNYRELQDRVEALGDRFEEMVPLYAEFLRNRLDNPYYEEVQRRLDQIPTLIDDRDFRNALEKGAVGPDAKREAVTRYIDTHPQGLHLSEAYRVLEGYPDEYAEWMKKQALRLEQAGKWDEAVRVCRVFLRQHPDHRQTPYFYDTMARLERRSIAERTAGDPAAAVEAYDAFIQRYRKGPEVDLAVRERDRILKEQKP